MLEQKARAITDLVSGIDFTDVLNLVKSLIEQFLGCGLSASQATTMMKRQGPVERLLLRGTMQRQFGSFNKKLFNATLTVGAKMKSAEVQKMMNEI